MVPDTTHYRDASTHVDSHPRVALESDAVSSLTRGVTLSSEVGEHDICTRLVGWQGAVAQSVRAEDS